MHELGTAIAVTLLTWWFSTGAILFLDGLPRWTFRWSMAVSGLLAFAALYLLHRIGGDVTARGAYLGFGAAILVWGFVEIAFLLGIVTGSWRQDCPEGVTGFERFVLAARTISHHELMLVAGLAAIAAVSWDQPNQTALWTYGVLWLMRLSTKLNIFLGMPNITIQFLPEHLGYLKSFFRHRPMNLLFPVSVTLGTVMTLLLCVAASQSVTGSYDWVSTVILATLAALGVIEHWFLVIPMDVAQLWSWGLRSHARPEKPAKHIVAPLREGAAGPAERASLSDAGSARPSLSQTCLVPTGVTQP